MPMKMLMYIMTNYLQCVSDEILNIMVFSNENPPSSERITSQHNKIEP